MKTDATIRKELSEERKSHRRRIAIVTNCVDDWGGSEELWGRSIPRLQKKGFMVTVLKGRINRNHPKFMELIQKGVALKELDPVRSQTRSGRMVRKLWQRIRRIYPNQLQVSFENYLQELHPDFVIISQGINFDGLFYADSCFSNKIPYVIISQKAVEFYWPQANDRTYMVNAYQHALRCYFVSEQNRVLTEEQFGFRFQNARIINNPVDISATPIPYPADDNDFRLACIGRLFVLDKGQDILLRILSMQKWKERKLSVTFVGTGVDDEGLQSMAKLLDVKNIVFAGHILDFRELWKEHHALVLPSRSEGSPLVVLEAMAAGRMVITTKAGADFIEDGKTGFVGEATTENFEQTLERAWQERQKWDAMGSSASKRIREMMPTAPEIDFANEITQMIYDL